MNTTLGISGIQEPYTNMSSVASLDRRSC